MMNYDLAEDSVNKKARERIESAHLGDLVFIVKRIAKKALSDDDAIFLASVLKEALNLSSEVTKDRIVELMMKRGRTRHKAEDLSAAIFK
ncbi:hypothetical protein HUN39_15580 [Methylocystis sp. FS]|nr:hypothetical protein [Methylocystis silviterrae]